MAFKYELLGRFNFRIVLYSGIIEVLITILVCYALAVSLGHKPVWLPTISECGEQAPEKHIFRWGIMTGGLLLVTEAVVLWVAKRASNHVFGLGAIAGLLLTGVACVASNEDLPVHLVFAFGFFILEDIMVILFTIENASKLSCRSITLKIACATVACVTTAARLLHVLGYVDYGDDVPWLAIVEWINVFALIGFHLTLSDDLDDLYVAELEEIEETGQTKTDLPTKIPL